MCIFTCCSLCFASLACLFLWPQIRLLHQRSEESSLFPSFSVFLSYTHIRPQKPDFRGCCQTLLSDSPSAPLLLASWYPVPLSSPVSPFARIHAFFRGRVRARLTHPCLACMCVCVCLLMQAQPALPLQSTRVTRSPLSLQMQPRKPVTDSGKGWQKDVASRKREEKIYIHRTIRLTGKGKAFGPLFGTFSASGDRQFVLPPDFPLLH